MRKFSLNTNVCIKNFKIVENTISYRYKLLRTLKSLGCEKPLFFNIQYLKHTAQIFEFH